MLILDSNVWIYLATADDQPVEIFSDYHGEVLKLFEDFRAGNRKTAISVYMMEEIIQGIERSERVSGEGRDEALTQLFGLIRTCDYIENDPRAADSADFSLRDVRQKPTVQMLGGVLGIQAKDVPILSLAYKYRHTQPHILTDDSDFAAFTPADYGMSAITISDAALSW